MSPVLTAHLVHLHARAWASTAFRLARAAPGAACLATALVLLLYALVTDLQARVVRASTMAGCAGGPRHRRRGEGYGEARALFTGDIEESSEPALLGWDGDLRSGAQGGPPRGADLVGAGLRRGGARVYRTDECGAVVVRVKREGRVLARAMVRGSCAR